MQLEDPIILIITEDYHLVTTLGGKFREWGLRYTTPILVVPLLPAENKIDLILLDVRRYSKRIWQLFSAVKQGMPLSEAVLINTSGNISASESGMRFGASDELMVPFDMETLRKKVPAACLRSRKRQKNRPGAPWLTFLKKP